MQNILVIVTDLGAFKAYLFEHTPNGTPRLEPVEEIAFVAPHQRVHETITDLAGRRGAPTQFGGGAPLADEHNLKLEMDRRVVRDIAKEIEKLIERFKPDACWLAAHKEINHQIIAELPQALRPRIMKNLPRDLTKVDPKEVIEQFRDNFPPP
jgi:hypothetical protein